MWDTTHDNMNLLSEKVWTHGQWNGSLYSNEFVKDFLLTDIDHV